MLAVVDYGVGNLFSLCSSLSALGIPSQVSGSAEVLRSASRIVLPGVGAFPDAMRRLRESGLAGLLCELAAQGKPILGICLGMQLLFERSLEFGVHGGLGILKGDVCPLCEDLAAGGFALKVPHMGWNPLRFVRRGSPLLKYSEEGDFVYYVHSFYAKNCEESLVAESEYGVRVPGVVQGGAVFGTQFHPEKSGGAGLAMLRAFAEVN